MQHIVSENYLCFYALLEMILVDIGNKHWDQFSLANKFGVVVPSGYKIEKISNVQYSDNDRDLGAHINMDAINEFFIKENIPLILSYIAANPYCEYPEETDDAICYKIYAFSYGSLYRQSENMEIGHVSLFLGKCLENKIRIYDPGPRDFGEKEISIFDMYDAMYDIRGGIYMLKKQGGNL